MDLLIEIGSRIKKRRIEKGISQQELAEAVGYSTKGMISQIEAGKVNLPMDKAVAIADYLDMKTSELIQTPTYKANYELLDGLSEENQRKVFEFIRFLKESEKWQKQSGMEKDGESAPARTGR